MRAIRQSIRLQLLGILASLTLAGPAFGVAITIDYSFDTSGFFDPGTADGLAGRTRLGEAATFYSNLLEDTLGAITPGGVNTWTATFPNPSTGALDSVVDLNVAADEILIFAGARSLSGSTLGIGGFGGFSASGTSSFLTEVSTRGELGVGTTDFAPWGGSITFDTSGTSWYFGASSSVLGGSSDFLSVAYHELAHALGIGTASSWNAMIVGDGSCTSGLAFGGAAANTSNGGADPCVESDAGHFENGLTNGGQEVAMDPSLTTGTRKLLTGLDIAALDDVGWEPNVVPEPGVGCLVALGLLGLGLRRR